MEIFAESIAYFDESKPQHVFHGDAKLDNLPGQYLFDLELCRYGHPALDIAMLLMQYKVPEQRWEENAKAYLSLRDGRDAAEDQLDGFIEALHFAKWYMGTKEIISSALRNPLGGREHRVSLASYLAA